MSAPSRFSEHDTERFYDAEDAHYRSFWDKAGSLHWGVFDEATGDDFLKACANLNDIMVRKSGLNAGARALDLGCGNGNTTIWLARSTGCRSLGVDLSGVRVGNAKRDLLKQSSELRDRVDFRKASATDLPFEDASFTHVWSQAAIYHVPNKEQALREAWRVLTPGGMFVFDDLTKPKQQVSQRAKKYVYDRLLFDTDYSFESYQSALRQVGFDVIEAIDLSRHLAASYSRLAKMAKLAPSSGSEHLNELSFAYERMVECIEDVEVGWALYVCRKPGQEAH
jgi:ubiquinone/menaquinone biosynthesis C-methylase UbiE